MKRWISRLFLGLCALLLLSACSSSRKAVTTTKVEKPVVVHNVTTDTLTVTKWKTDTVMLHDSVVVTEKGVDRWHTRYIARLHVDTIYKVRVDSVPKVVKVTETKTETVTKEVPRKAHWWQIMLESIGGGALAVFVFSIIRRIKK